MAMTTQTQTWFNPRGWLLWLKQQLTPIHDPLDTIPDGAVQTLRISFTEPTSEIARPGANTICPACGFGTISVKWPAGVGGRTTKTFQCDACPRTYEDIGAR